MIDAYRDDFPYLLGTMVHSSHMGPEKCENPTSMLANFEYLPDDAPQWAQKDSEVLQSVLYYLRQEPANYMLLGVLGYRAEADVRRVTVGAANFRTKPDQAINPSTIRGKINAIFPGIAVDGNTLLKHEMAWVIKYILLVLYYVIEARRIHIQQGCGKMRSDEVDRKMPRLKWLMAANTLDPNSFHCMMTNIMGGHPERQEEMVDQGVKSMGRFIDYLMRISTAAIRLAVGGSLLRPIGVMNTTLKLLSVSTYIAHRMQLEHVIRESDSPYDEGMVESSLKMRRFDLLHVLIEPFMTARPSEPNSPYRGPMSPELERKLIDMANVSVEELETKETGEAIPVWMSRLANHEAERERERDTQTRRHADTRIHTSTP